MKPVYQKWINDNVNETYGRCKEISDAMRKAFPELTLVRGFYYCPYWGERQHWWLTDGDEIVDPTVEQFPSKGTGHYEPLDESKPQPTGLCPNCGGYCFDGNYCCSEACHNAYAAYCSHG